MSSDEYCVIEMKPKKKNSTGRLRDVRKKLLASTHEVGPDCNCKRLKCFQEINDRDRKKIIGKFNELTVNEQNSYLAGLIIVSHVVQRRPRQDEEAAKLHTASYSYRVRVTKVDDIVEIPVCFKAFCSLHGVSKKKIEIIQRYLKTGSHPVDKRGRHSNRKHKLSQETFDAVYNHIASFKGERAHYSLKKNKKLYLPPELSVKKMYELFKEKCPNNSLSYERYRQIFNEKFNIGFGYPRKDTCSNCDSYAAELKAIQTGLRNCQEGSEEKKIAESKLKKLSVENKLHLTKANMFYVRKKQSRLSSQKDQRRESIAMDYQKNLSVPNITTNDVYYRRQLTVCMFNIHVLSTNESYYYAYDETVAKKGADEVASFLFDFVMTKLDPKVKELDIFCDYCAGQNKNWTIFRMVHYLVHYVKRLDEIKMNFPIRGHSYLECDRNMVCINQKKWLELPKDWYEEFQSARVKPSPFQVIEVDKELTRKWTMFFSELYYKSCPFKSRPVRELIVMKQHPRLLKFRLTYFGHWEGHVVNAPKSTPAADGLQPCEGEFVLPEAAYLDAIPISFEKFSDLQQLKMFCGKEARDFYSNLPKAEPVEKPERKKAAKQVEKLERKKAVKNQKKKNLTKSLHL